MLYCLKRHTMSSNKFEKTVGEIFALAGIEVNGDNPWDIQVHNKEFYKRALVKVELGIGESYMDGWWDCAQIDELICKVIRAKLDEKLKRNFSITYYILIAKIINLQSPQRAFNIGKKHYDLGNDLFQNMLDKRMNYSCAYWKKAHSLDEAQENKLELICRKINLKPGMRVLDIGCGWGAFGKYAAEKYDVTVVGITVSKEQLALGKELCKGLLVEFRLQDYRDINEKFDCIVSVGMIEHVGYKNYRTYFEVANKCLNDKGLFLLHTIGNKVSEKAADPWMNKYIFPDGMLPSIEQLGKAIENLFIMEDWHNFGTDYEKTLMSWFNNFDNNYDKIKDKYNERFYRMWKYYLLFLAGTFRARRNQLWQIVLSKDGVIDGYQSIR
ncbi:MAG: cyclopropane fatty acyl phospholipid synthase [Ignavibacteriaceae bacterium]